MKQAYAVIIDLAETLIISVGIFVIIWMFLFRPFQVNGSSMYPNYHDNEFVLTNIISLHFEPLKRGDVIIFHAPPEPSRDFIKRIIGLPKDKVLLKEGFVYVNGKKLDESAYLPPHFKTYGGEFMKDNVTITVPKGQLFVLGDNREFSSDSRSWGFVPENKVIGRSLLVYWPPQYFRIVPSVNGSYH